MGDPQQLEKDTQAPAMDATTLGKNVMERGERWYTHCRDGREREAEGFTLWRKVNWRLESSEEQADMRRPW